MITPEFLRMISVDDERKETDWAEYMANRLNAHLRAVQPTVYTDPDINALAKSIEALNGSTSRHMLVTNFGFLKDYFIDHPSRELPAHLKVEN